MNRWGRGATRWGLDRATRRSCRALAEQLPLPAPFDLDELLAMVSRRRGHPVLAQASDALPDGITGRVWFYEDCDLIEYQAGTTDLRKRHITFHEIAHLLLARDRDLEAALACRGDLEDDHHDPAVEYLAECLMLRSLRLDAALAARVPVPQAAAALAAQLDRCLDRPRSLE
jgi:hypothetical protein